MSTELEACTPVPLHREGFKKKAVLPFGLTTEHIKSAMNEWLSFLGFINTQLNGKGLARFETMLMPANFSSMVGEFAASNIPKFCKTLAKNNYHNGHPDLIPAGVFPNNSVQHDPRGIEIKGSRYLKAWQGHNAEDCWLMVYVFGSNRPVDESKGIAPRPFEFVRVVGAQLTKADWKFAGRSETSRRTITASVTQSGFDKMMNNTIYEVPDATIMDMTDSDEDNAAE